MTDSSPYSLEYRLMAAFWYHKYGSTVTGVKNMKRKLRKKFEGEPPDTRVIQTWEEKLFQTGSILDLPRGGRPRERGDEQDNVEQSLQTKPCLSIRQRAEELDIPTKTLHRIIKEDLGYKCWRPTKVQYLSEEDHFTRVQCCQQILAKYDNNTRRSKLFFTDECAVYAEGRGQIMMSFWSKKNPYFWEQVQQHPPSVMVWAAISASHLIGPFFIHGSVTSASYIDMLKSKFVPALQRKGILLSSHFQQDGAPAHTAHATRDFLQQTFQDRWVGKYGPTPWPPRSPDLTSCDNALWGILKPKILAHKAANVDELKAAITAAFLDFPRNLLERINTRTFRRLHLCVAHDGLQVEPYDI